MPDVYCASSYLSGSETLTTVCTSASPVATTTGARLYQKGAKHSGNFFVKSGAMCVSTPQTAGYGFYARGAEIPLASFVEYTDAAPVTL